jgi:hypothetical protein
MTSKHNIHGCFYESCVSVVAPGSLRPWPVLELGRTTLVGFAYEGPVVDGR